MSAKHHYIISIFNVYFKSLEEAKRYVMDVFTPFEAKKYLYNDEICHFIGDKLHSVTPIKVDDSGNISFGRTRKLI